MITVGSSDVAPILGLSPWSGPWDTWARLTGIAPRYSSPDSPATARGRMLEPAIGARYATEHGLVPGIGIRPGPAITEDPILHPTDRWMAARPDFVVLAGGPRLVEAKTARFLDAEDGWGEPGTDAVPMHYLAQVVWQMAVCAPTLGVDRTDLAAFGTYLDDWRIYTVIRREGVEQSIVSAVRDWYERHIIGEMPPPIDGSPGCGATLRKLYPGRDGEVRQADPVDLALARDLARVRGELEALSTQAAGIEHAMQDRMGDAQRLLDPATQKPIATWQIQRGRRTLDTTSIRQAHPDIADQHTRVSEPRRVFRFTPTNQESE